MLWDLIFSLAASSRSGFVNSPENCILSSSARFKNSHWMRVRSGNQKKSLADRKNADNAKNDLIAISLLTAEVGSDRNGSHRYTL